MVDLPPYLRPGGSDQPPPVGWRSDVRCLRSPAVRPRELTAAQRNAVTELLRVSPVADELGRRFAEAGHELHLVGGSVRDALLGRLGDDLDFCTDAPPRRDPAASSRAGPRRSGRPAGSSAPSARSATGSGWRSPPTAPRRTTGSAATRWCEYGTNLHDDLRPARLHINAMAVSLPGHEFTDPFGGLDDLAARVIRTPGTPGAVVRRRPAADAAGRPVRRPAALRRRPGRASRR